MFYFGTNTPGFDLLSEDLQDYREKSAGKKSGRLEKFSLTATQAILYFDSIAAGDTVTLHFRLRAKYPVTVDENFHQALARRTRAALRSRFISSSDTYGTNDITSVPS